MTQRRISYQLTRVCHALRLHMDQTLRKAELTTPQYMALSTIEETPGLSGHKLARRCSVTSQTMSLILLSLEKAELIVRQPHPVWKRTLQIYLTPKGKMIVQENRPGILHIEETLVASLAEEERLQLWRLLHTCVNVLEAPQDGKARISDGFEVGKPDDDKKSDG